jgi:hypothetical protein
MSGITHWCGDHAGKLCSYRTTDMNAMSVHLLTKHELYYCMKCRARFGQGQIQVYKAHEKICGVMNYGRVILD